MERSLQEWLADPGSRRKLVKSALLFEDIERLSSSS
jgi:hypothetical protein